MIRDDNIGDNHDQWLKYSECWETIKDVLDGECSVKHEGKTYLPKPCGMDKEDYSEYKKRARFVDLTASSIMVLCGRLFKKEPLINIPDNVDLSNIGGVDTNLSVLAKNIAYEVSAYARHGVLVDYDEIIEQPKLVPYNATDIVNWHVENGKLDLLVLQEIQDHCSVLENSIPECRLVLYLDENGEYAIERCEKDGNTDTYIRSEPVYPTIQGRRLNFIPFVFFSPFGNNSKIDRPPLYGLASDAIAWYNTSADKRHSLHLTALATPYMKLDVAALKEMPTDKDGNTGFENLKVELGSTKGLMLPGGSEITFAEISGSGADRLQSELDDIKQDMLLKAGLISSGNLTNTAAETAMIAQSGQVAALDALATNISSGITKALKIWAEWAGFNSDDFSFELNREFFDRKLNPQEITSLVQAYQNGIIDIDTVRDNLREAGIVSADVTNEEIAEKIEEDINLIR